MKKIINYILVSLVLLLNVSFVKAEIIDDLVSKLPAELNNCYGKIYNKDAASEKIDYKVNLDDDMLYITQEKDGKTVFVEGFTFADNIISYEEIYNKDTNYQELEQRNEVNYLAIFNVVAVLTRETTDTSIIEDFKINIKRFTMQEELEQENNKESNSGRRTTGYVIATIIVIIGLMLLVFFNRDFIFGGKFFK